MVHPYTFRAENTFLPKDYQVGTSPSDLGRAVDEQVAYLKTGIDGLFTDQADISVRARAVAAGLPNPGPPPADHHPTH